MIKLYNLFKTPFYVIKYSSIPPWYFYCMTVYHNCYLLKITIIIIYDEHLGLIFIHIHGNCL